MRTSSPYLDSSLVIIKTPNSMKATFSNLTQHRRQKSSFTARHNSFSVHLDVWAMTACSDDLEVVADRLEEILKSVRSAREVARSCK
jgi:hypothetical protein